MSEIKKYKFNEDKWISVIRDYIDKTYKNPRYYKNSIQATEFVNDYDHMIGFTLGNIIKYAQHYYAQRYNEKGTKRDHQNDIFKIIHYAILLLELEDNAHGSDESQVDDDELVNDIPKDIRYHRQTGLDAYENDNIK